MNKKILNNIMIFLLAFVMIFNNVSSYASAVVPNQNENKEVITNETKEDGVKNEKELTQDKTPEEKEKAGEEKTEEKVGETEKDTETDKSVENTNKPVDKKEVDTKLIQDLKVELQKLKDEKEQLLNTKDKDSETSEDSVEILPEDNPVMEEPEKITEEELFDIEREYDDKNKDSLVNSNKEERLFEINNRIAEIESKLKELESVEDNNGLEISEPQILQSLRADNPFVGTLDAEVQLNWLDGNVSTSQTHISQDWKSGSKDIRGRMLYKITADDENEFKPGELEITIPRYLYSDRDGKPIGEITLGVPQFPSAKQKISYIDAGDTIKFVNVKPLPRATTAYIEFTYKALKPELIKDKVTGYKSDTISANLKLVHNDKTVEREAKNKLTTDVDTEAVLTSINDGIYSPYGYPYEVYPDIFPEELKPVDEDKYVYADYVFNMSHNATQPYKVKFDASATNFNGKILGVRSSADSKVIKGNGSSSISFDIEAENKFGTDIRGTNTVRVFVAYPISQFSGNQIYPLTVNGKYTLTSEDDKQVTSKNATETINYRPIIFSAPDNHFGIIKNGDGNSKTWNGHKYEGDYNYALNQLLLGKDVDLLYNTYVQAFTLPFTYPSFNPKENNKSDNLDNYKQRQFKTEVVDGEVDTQYQNLNYEIKSVDISNLTLYDYVKYPSSGNGFFENAEGRIDYGFIPIGYFGYKSKSRLSDFEIKNKTYTFQILGSKDGTNYTPYANVNIDSGVSLEALNGASIEGNKVVFPSGVKKYKSVLSSGLPGYTYTLKPTITIKADAKSKTFAEKAMSKDIPLDRVKTLGGMIGVTDTNQTVNSKPDYAHDRLMGIVSGVRLKHDLTYSNDVDNARVNVSYRLTMQNQTNQTDLKDIKAAAELGLFKEEKKGTWYTLLPTGLDININSVKAGRYGDSITRKEIIKNYKNTGRDLLIVELNQTPKYRMKFKQSEDNFINIDGYADEPEITFEGKYSWVMMKANAIKLPGDKVDYRLNVDAVYKSENEDIGSLKTLQGENSSATENKNRYTPKPILDEMKDIEGKDNKNSYLFYKGVDSLSVDTAATIGVDKLVDVNGEKDFTTGTSYDDQKSVYENGYYSYRIIISTDERTKAQDLIVYDKIDAYELNEEDDQEFGAKQFKGIFNNLDLSMADALKIKPVVYYSTKKDINIDTKTVTSDMDLNSSAWTTVKPKNEDITAVAIDLSKKTDGTKFVLDRNQAFMVEMQVKAPAIKDVGEDSFAFNKSTFIYKNAMIPNPSNIVAATQKTKIGIKPFYIDVRAKWDDDDDRDGKRPEDIKVKLVRDGQEIGEEVTLNEANKLFASIDNVEYQDETGKTHSYTLKVTNSNKDYNYIINGPKQFDDRLEFEIVAKHEPERITIKGKKIWEGKQIGIFKKYEESYLNRPTSIKVVLYRNGEEYKTITVVPDKDNNWNFESPSEYKYENKGQEIKYEFREDEYIKGYIPAEYADNGRTIINKYYPFGDLKITKHLVDTTKKAAEQSFNFEFKIETLNKDGQTYSLNNDTYNYITETGRKGKVSTGGIIEIKPVNGRPEEITIKDLPTESKVTIIEQDKPGFRVTKKKQSMEIMSGREQELHFENTYDTKGKVLLKANKTVNGRKLDPFFFLFDLYNKNGNIEQSVRNDSNGDVYFEAVEYGLRDIDRDTSTGKFEYIIKERQTNKPGYTYDNKEYKVVVDLQDNGDGTITATPSYSLNGSKIDLPKFTNEYKAFGDLSVSTFKSIKHTTIKPEENTVEYTLYDEQGHAITTAKNDKQGRIVLNVDKHYTEKDINKSYIYTVKETDFDRSAFEENTEYLKFRDTVKDNGDGTLSVTQEFLGRFDNTDTKVDAEDNTIPMLENLGKNSELKVVKKVQGDYKDPNKLFRFKIKFTGDKEIVPKKLEIERRAYTAADENSAKANSILFPEELDNSQVSSLTGGLDLSISNVIETYNVMTPMGSGNEDTNVILEDEEIGYEVLEDMTDENAIILNVQNFYADGLRVTFHSNNGETKFFKKEYKPKDLLTTEAFPGNQDNWGNPGLIIKGWSTDPSATEPMYKVNEPIKNTDIYTKRSTEEATLNKVDLYAVWGKPGFTITFNKNTGDGSMADQTVEYDKATALNANTFYKLGKRFVGWSLTADGEIEYEDKAEITKSESQVVNEKLTLYAIWEDDNLTLNSDNGEFEFTLREDELATLKNIPSYLEYEITELPDPAWGLVNSENTKGVVKATGNELAKFTNEYGAKSVQYIFTGAKKIDGTASSLDDFEFKLLDKQTNRVYLTKANQITGIFNFEAMLFTKPGTYNFEVSEVAHDNPNYTVDSKVYQVQVTVTEEAGQLVAKSNVDNIEFNNKAKAAKIRVTKTIDGDWIDPSRSFVFKANINGKEEEFTLGDGETKEFDTVYGADYTIEETSSGNWTISSENTTGLVDKDVVEVNFTNTSTLSIDDPSGPTKTIRFKKALEGRTLKDKEFKFSLKFKDSNGDLLREEILTNDENGNVEIEVPYLLVTKSSSITSQEINSNDDSVIYRTMIFEIRYDKYTDSFEYRWINRKKFKPLEDLVIKNKVKPGYLNLKLNVINGTEKTKDKEFTVNIKVDDEIKTYTFKNGEEQKIELPSGTKYTITSDNLPKGFKLENIVNEAGEIIANTTTNAVVNISYNAEAKFTVQAKKKMLDANNKESAELLKQYTFNYVLLDEEDNIIGRTQNDSEGNIVFTDINYGLGDIDKTYKYKLAELEDGQYGIIFDKSQFDITVKVEDTGEGLNLVINKERNLNNENTQVDNLEFINKYKLPIDTPVTGLNSSLITVIVLMTMIVIGYIVRNKKFSLTKENR